MKALECSEQRTLSLVEKPVPMPTIGLVRIKVAYASICRSDQHILDNDILLRTSLPRVIGHEAAGFIDAIGDSVEGLVVGEPVVTETAYYTCGECEPCRSGNYQICTKKLTLGYAADGVFEEFFLTPAKNVYKLGTIPLLHGVLVEPLACITHAMMEVMQIPSGSLVVISGPGIIGQLAAQVARQDKSNEVYMIGTWTSQDRLSVANDVNISTVLNTEAERLFSTITDGHGVDVYIECAGAKASADLGLKLLARRGTYMQIGLFSRDDTTPIALDLIAYKEITALGSISSRRSSWEKALGLLRNNRIVVEPLLSPPYRLEDWERAFGDAKGGKGIKIIFGM